MRHQTGGKRARRSHARRSFVERLESKQLLAVITVTGTGDTIANDGIVTLREAITAANTNLASGDAPAGESGTVDIIEFNIPASDARHFYYVEDGQAGFVTRFDQGGSTILGTTTEAVDANIPTSGANAIDADWLHSFYSIQLSSALPDISEPLAINGYSQPGAVANTNPITGASNAILRIELTAATGNEINGLRFTSGESSVRGLAIHGFGFFDRPHGIVLASGVNVVAGNHIGADVSGLDGLGNQGDGVFIDNASQNEIGGLNPEDRNIFKANRYGIEIVGTAASVNRVRGNQIGDSPNGAGVRIAGGATDNTVGGTVAAAANMIGGNQQTGVWITEAGTAGNFIQGNFIGIVPTAAEYLSNNTSVLINFAGSGNVIGAETSVPGTEGGNVITGALYGIFVVDSDGTLIQGNLIGTDATGLIAVPAFYSGIIIQGGTGTVIGGESSRAGNLIAGARRRGAVSVGGDGTLIRNNLIGSNSNGERLLDYQDQTQDFVSGGGGIQAYGSNTLIADNLIAFHGIFIEEDGSPQGGGISVRSGTGHRILRNSIHSNDGLGIEILEGEFPDGVPLVNDPGDPDGGPNALQNAPQITEVIDIDADFVEVRGTLSSTPLTEFNIELFANLVGDPSGSGEGEQFLGIVGLATDANGNGTFALQVERPLGNRRVYSATATSQDNNTSEFSSTFTVSDGVPLSDLSVTISDSPDPVVPGQQITYTITVQNVGPDAADSAVLTFPIPNGTTFVSFSPPSGWTQSTPPVGGTGQIQSLFPLLGVNQPAIFTVVVQVDASHAEGEPISATATVTQELNDPNPDNDNAQTSTDVGPPAPVLANVTVSLSDSPDPVNAGQSFAYTLIISNTGDAGATGVSALLTLPAGLQVVSPGGGTATETGLSFAVGSLAAGAQSQFQIVVVAQAQGTYTATGTVAADTGIPVGGPAQAATTVLAAEIDITPPTVVDVRRFGFHAQHTVLVVRFSEAIDADGALQAASYAITTSGRDGRLGTSDDRAVAANALAYNPETFELTIRTAPRIHVFKPAQFSIVDGALRDLAGNVLDGDGDGTAGGAYGTILNRQSLAGPAFAAPGAIEVGLRGPRRARLKLAKRAMKT